jgi:cellulose 1,4-beta-cellobiosidase
MPTLLSILVRILSPVGETMVLTGAGRNGVQPTKQNAWGDWCNVIGTGFGVRPTTNTGNSLVDAFVWVKPGGESDGTSDSSAARYDAHCGYSDALQPAPEAGTWFQVSFPCIGS